MIFFNKKMYVFPFSFISLWHLIDLIINTVSINIFAPWSWRQRTAAASLLCMCLKHAKNLQFSIPYRGDAHKGVANRNSCPKLAHPSIWPWEYAEDAWTTLWKMTFTSHDLTIILNLHTNKKDPLKFKRHSNPEKSWRKRFTIYAYWLATILLISLLHL